MGNRGYLVGLAGLTALYLGLAAWLPPADDEIYYWCWAKHLQLSYFDHPPMTGWLIRASMEAFGDSLFATRLPAVLASVVTLGVIGWLSRPRHLLVWVGLTPLFTFGAVLVTPDTPLLLFWSAYLGWLAVAHRRLDAAGSVPWWLWLVGGVALGCAGLGKYTSALAVPAGGLSFVLSRKPWRAWLPGYLGHGVVAGLLVVPVFVFNSQHGFEPMRFQLNHAAQGSGDRSGLETFAEFIGIQVLLFGTLPVLLFPWLAWRLRRLSADPTLRACGCMAVVPMAVFLLKSTRGPLEGNWALAAYVGFWPVAAHWYGGVSGSAAWRWAVRASFPVPLGCVAVLAVHLVRPIGVIPPGQDRITRQPAKEETARQIAAVLRDQPEQLPVYVPTYQWTAWLRYNGIDARQMDGVSRPSNFTLSPEHLTDVDRAYVVIEGPADPPHPGLEAVGRVPLVVRGETLLYFHVLKYVKPKG